MARWIVSVVIAVSALTTFVAADPPSCSASQNCPSNLPCCSRSPLFRIQANCRIRSMWYGLELTVAWLTYQGLEVIVLEDVTLVFHFPSILACLLLNVKIENILLKMFQSHSLSTQLISATVLQLGPTVDILFNTEAISF